MSSDFQQRYQIVGLIGSGGQASVFHARDRKLGRDVALKLLSCGQPDGESEARFQRECAVLARLAHPAIVPVLDFGRSDEGVPYLAMPLLAGAESLAAVVRAGRIDPPRLTPACRQALTDVAEALDLIHAQGLFHRDIKPSNILIVPPGRGVIIDFGLVRVADQAMTATGVAPGTPAYLSPELARFEAAGAPSDQFQLGLVAYHLITGAQPVTDPVEFARRASCGQPPVPLPSTRRADVPPSVDHVLRRVTAADADRRYPSCRAFIEALCTALDSPGAAPHAADVGAARPVALASASRHKRQASRRRRRALAPALVGVVLASIAWLARPATTTVELADVRVERTLRGVTVRFKRVPAGPAHVVVTAGGTQRVVDSAADGEQHVVPVTMGGEAAAVTLEARAGDRAAPAVTVAWAPPKVHVVGATAGERGLAIEFETSIAARARVSVLRGSETIPVPGQDTAETDHRVLAGTRLMPFYPLVRVELSTGADSLVQEVKLEGAARHAWLELAARWFAAQVAAYWQRYMALPGETPIPKDIDLAARRLEAELPPPWLLEEAGGAGGALELLEHRGRAHDLWVAIRRVADLNALREVVGIRERYPIEKVFGAHAGWSDRPHYPGARVLDITPPELSTGQAKELLPPVHVHALDGSLPLRPGVLLELGFDVALPPIAGGRRVELHARAVFPPGRLLGVQINDELVYLGPVGGRASGAGQDVYAAFDPAWLRRKNRIQVRCNKISSTVEVLHRRPGVRIERLFLRIEE